MPPRNVDVHTLYCRVVGNDTPLADVSSAFALPISTAGTDFVAYDSQLAICTCK